MNSGRGLCGLALLFLSSVCLASLSNERKVVALRAANYNGIQPEKLHKRRCIEPGKAVKDTSIKMAERKKDWALTHNALHNLLLWLDEGADSAGEKYLEMRRRLVAYFDRKNCPSPDELADETLNRVARRLEEEGAITGLTPAHYCYTVAKFIFLEYLRRVERQQVNLDDVTLASPAASAIVAAAADDETAREAQRQNCFEQCLQNLEPDNRELIVQYYHGEQRTKIENRRAMAARLGITMNALGIRACRLRDRLEACVSGCLRRGE